MRNKAASVWINRSYTSSRNMQPNSNVSQNCSLCPHLLGFEKNLNYKEYPMRKLLSVLAVSLTAIALVVGTAPISSSAASHREAPLISMDPTADITDFFMFRSYETDREDYIVLIMDVIPGEEPSAGPNYYNFDPSVLYSINIDNDQD